MTDVTRGEKRQCLNCAAKFFDLGKASIACPKCGAAFVPVELPRSPPRRIGRPFAAQPFDVRPAVADVAEDEVDAVAAADEPAEDDDEDAVAVETDARP
jgi:hypothetical protein